MFVSNYTKKKNNLQFELREMNRKKLQAQQEEERKRFEQEAKEREQKAALDRPDGSKDLQTQKMLSLDDSQKTGILKHFYLHEPILTLINDCFLHAFL